SSLSISAYVVDICVGRLVEDVLEESSHVLALHIVNVSSTFDVDVEELAEENFQCLSADIQLLSILRIQLDVPPFRRRGEVEFGRNTHSSHFHDADSRDERGIEIIVSIASLTVEGRESSGRRLIRQEKRELLHFQKIIGPLASHLDGYR
ncbi:hypothetical protein PFISCL1PPCAC_16646, partial [Pristionchus fissidentatus]